MAKSLFEEEGADELAIRVNTDFAERYEYRKKREELSRLKDKYGEDLEEEESSSEEEDEDADLLTPDVDADILRTLSLIKSRDPRIYDKSSTFYEEKEEGEEEVEAKPKQEKKMTLKDYERRELLTKGAEGAFNSDSEGDMPKKKGKSYLEEQAELKESLKKSLAAMDDSEEEEGLFEVRIKTQDEEDVEHEDYLRWLRGEEEKVKNRKVAEMETLKRYWTDPNLDPNEKFLRDYVLTKGWVDKDDEPARAPKPATGEAVDDDEDAEAVDAMDAFEAKYNFRYEEEGGTELKTYPRNIPDSLRRPDDRRKLERDRKRETKKKAKDEKKEELKRLKNLKKLEIADKLKQIEQLTGTQVQGIDLDGDFDPAAYEKQMQALFNDQYYEQDDDEKPVFEDDPELGVEDWEDELEGDYAPEIEAVGEEEGKEKKKKKKKKGKEVEEEGKEAEAVADDGDFNMDADYEDTRDTAGDAPVPDRPLSKSAKKKQKKLLGRLLRNIEDTRQTPAYDPASGLSFDQYLEEYYKLDYEDMIGDMPVRFKYRQVVANDYGLSASEVLKADDRELNQWASLRNMTKYRPMKYEKKDVEKYKDIPTWRKARVVPSALKGYKKKQPADAQPGMGGDKKKTKKKENKEEGEGEGSGVKEEPQQEAATGAEGEAKKKRKKKKKKAPTETVAPKEQAGTEGEGTTWSREAFNSKLVGDDRLAAYAAGTMGAKRPAKGSKSAHPAKKQRKG